MRVSKCSKIFSANSEWSLTRLNKGLEAGKETEMKVKMLSFDTGRPLDKWFHVTIGYPQQRGLSKLDGI